MARLPFRTLLKKHLLAWCVSIVLFSLAMAPESKSGSPKQVTMPFGNCLENPPSGGIIFHQNIVDAVYKTLPPARSFYIFSKPANGSQAGVAEVEFYGSLFQGDAAWWLTKPTYPPKSEHLKVVKIWDGKLVPVGQNPEIASNKQLSFRGIEDLELQLTPSYRDSFYKSPDDLRYYKAEIKIRGKDKHQESILLSCELSTSKGKNESH